MQDRNVTDNVKQDNFDSRPAYQFCTLLESTSLDYMAFALKSDRFNDDMDEVRKHLQSLKLASKTSRQIVKEYEEKRSMPQKPILKSRSETALRKSKQAEAKLKEIQNEFEASHKILKNEEELILEQIAIAEENEEYQARQQQLSQIEQMTSEKNLLLARREKIEKRKSRIFIFDSSKDNNDLSYIDAQERNLEFQIKTSSRELAKHKNKFEYLPKRKAHLETLRVRIKNNEDAYKVKIASAQTELEMAEARLYMETADATREEINYFSQVSIDISFVLLRAYIRFIEINECIETTYQAMLTSHKTYLSNQADPSKDPLVRIGNLCKLSNKSMTKINTMASLVRCKDVEEKDILELYEAYKNMPANLQKKFMDDYTSMDFKSIFILILSDLPQKETKLSRQSTVSTLFLQAKDNNRRSVREKSVETSPRP